MREAVARGERVDGNGVARAVQVVLVVPPRAGDGVGQRRWSAARSRPHEGVLRPRALPAPAARSGTCRGTRGSCRSAHSQPGRPREVGSRISARRYSASAFSRKLLSSMRGPGRRETPPSSSAGRRPWAGTRPRSASCAEPRHLVVRPRRAGRWRSSRSPWPGPPTCGRPVPGSTRRARRHGWPSPRPGAW